MSKKQLHKFYDLFKLNESFKSQNILKLKKYKSFNNLIYFLDKQLALSVYNSKSAFHNLFNFLQDFMTRGVLSSKYN